MLSSSGSSVSPSSHQSESGAQRREDGTHPARGAPTARPAGQPTKPARPSARRGRKSTRGPARGASGAALGAQGRPASRWCELPGRLPGGPARHPSSRCEWLRGAWLPASCKWRPQKTGSCRSSHSFPISQGCLRDDVHPDVKQMVFLWEARPVRTFFPGTPKSWTLVNSHATAYPDILCSCRVMYSSPAVEKNISKPMFLH